MAHGLWFSLAGKYLTFSEYDAQEDTFKKRFESLQSMLRDLGDRGLSRIYHYDDPIDLLFGTEVPLNPEDFVWVDLIFKSDLAENAGHQAIVLWLHKSRAPVFSWAQRLMDDKWPPESRLLDARAWALLFVPQIARELTLNLWKELSHATAESLGFAFHKESYTRLGPH